MIVDISPMVVNKTAMYHIVRDTVRHLIDCNYEIELTAIGEILDVKEFVKNNYDIGSELNSLLFGKLVKDIDEPKHVDNEFWLKSEIDNQYLLFDPLYLMYASRYKKILCMVLDLTPVTRPIWHGEKISNLYKENIRLLYDKNIQIISISDSTKRDLWANYGILPERIHVVGLYDRFKSSKRKTDPKEKYFLFVGSLEIRKNIMGLIKGFEASNLSNLGYILNIVGGNALGSDEVKSYAGKVAGVNILGRVDDVELDALYEGCMALAYPSQWEGFGVPALEAANRGIPLILSDCGALPEVVGEHALYVDSANVASISEGFLNMANLNQNHNYKIVEMVEHAYAFAQKYTFSNYIEQIEKLIND